MVTNRFLGRFCGQPAQRHSQGALYLYWNVSGLFRGPQFTTPDRDAARAYEDRHIVFAYVLLALAAVHVAAALWHHFIGGVRIALRMVADEAV